MKKEKLWCCISTNFKNSTHYDWSTLSYTRRDSKIKFLPSQGNFTSWKYWIKKGWKCVKVEMTLEII